MSEVVKRLAERRANVWEQAKALADRAAEENRAFNGEEESQWAELNAELDRLDVRAKALIAGEQRAKDIEDSYSKLNGRPAAAGRENGQTEVETQLRSFLRGDHGSPRMLEVNATGKVDFRTLSKLTAAAGLNTVPTDFYNQIVEYLVETSGLLQAGVTVINTSGGEALQIPKATSHGSAAITAEAAAIGASDPVFAQNTLGAYKYGQLVQVSRELIDDAGFDLEGYLARACGRNLGNAIGAHLVVGTGTNQPQGIVPAATLGVTGAAGSAAGGPTADNLIDLVYSVIAPYRNSRSSAFLIRDAGMGALRKIKDTTGQFIFQPSLTAGTPDVLLGERVFVDPFVPSGASNRHVVYGDMSAYFVRFAGGVRFERSEEYAFNTDMVTFRAVLRGDGALTDPSAVKAFVAAAT